MKEKNKFMKVLSNHKVLSPPLWIMRQAGRHLPEYINLREKEQDFIKFCLNSEKAAEASLQPMRRYDLDAAILFSDILIIPYSLNRSVIFKKGVGPILDPITINDIPNLRIEEEIYEKIAQTVKNIKMNLKKGKALIGFAGAPWTVATYMIEGGGSKTKEKSISFALKEPNSMKLLLDKLIDATVIYLEYQAKSGVDVLKLFESWAGGLPEILHETLLIEPVNKIIDKLKKKDINLPIICFPKGLGPNYELYAKKVNCEVLALDSSLPLSWIKEKLQPRKIVQGNLDPLILLAGGNILRENVWQIKKKLRNYPYIFNLGNGILPNTPIKNVYEMISYIREE